MPLSRVALLLFLAPLLVGCGLFQNLQVESLAQSSKKPGNVAVYLSVADGQEPVTDLLEQNFRIYENERLIDESETRQTLLQRDVAAHHRTLLLLDMSAAKDEGVRQRLARAVAGFVAIVRKTQGVTVYAFDGRADIVHIGDFPKGESGPSEMPGISSFKVQDPSRNLHGAAIAGLKELGARLMTQQKPVRVGTLVVMTAGPDLAGRATIEQLEQAIEASGRQLVAIGVGAEGSFELSGLDKDGALWAQTLGSSGPTLDEAATRVQRLMERHYLLSYCSPARAGRRMVRIEVVHETMEGKELKGDISFEIDATGFGADCDPSKPPGFGATGSASVTEAGSDEGAPKSDPPSGPPKEGSGKGQPPPEEDAIVPPPNKPGYAPPTK